MATRNYVPRANGEGSIGTEKKHWGKGFFQDLVVGGKAIQDFVKDIGIESSDTGSQTGWIKFGNGVLIQWRHAPVNQDFDPPIAFKDFDVGFATSNSGGLQYAGLTYDNVTKKFHLHGNSQEKFWLYTLLIGRWK